MQNRSHFQEGEIGKNMQAMKKNNGEEQERRKHQKISPVRDQPEPRSSLTEPESIARNYQLEALEMARKQNTIAFLETGSGKTLIAILLLKTYAHMFRKPSEFIAVFLVPRVVLVTQQAKAIEMHTDLKVGKFWGEMGVDLWDAQIWKEHLDKFEVFVMTPQILLDNLRHSFFKLDAIKLLIFDECHHARGRSPYACIMTEFYHRQLLLKSTRLPRIFGMTASLIKSKGSGSSMVYGKQIQELESLLNSKVYTVEDDSVLSKYIPSSTIKLKLYRHLDIPNPLFWSLADHLKNLKQKHIRGLHLYQLNENAKDGAAKKISRLHDTFFYCLTELGAWLALKAAESLSCNESDIFFWGERKDGFNENIVRSFSREVSEIFSQYMPQGQVCCIGDNIKADLDAGFLSKKVECLILSLLDYRHLKDLRCIIFVERVITAIVLQVLLCQLENLSCWKATYTAGNHSGLQSQTRNEQMKIVNAFRDGTVNIIVATEILEEGLDVKACNLVIRFDPSPTVCSFIQSRGRARMQGSEYLLIVRSDDHSTLSRVEKYLSSGDIMREESLRLAPLPCPPLDSSMLDEDYYCVETTGAQVTLNSSVALIYFYCSRLPADGYFKPCPRFDIDKDSNVCTLHLPNSCPVPAINVHGQNDMLKQIACLEACKKLHQIGALTDYLLPESVPDVKDDTSESGDNQPNQLQFSYFPGELVGCWPSNCEKELYHCYSISFRSNFNYKVPFRNIILMTKYDLESDFANIGFGLETNRGSVNVNLECASAIQLSVEQVRIAKRFQTTLLRLLIDQNLSKLKDALDERHQEGHDVKVVYLMLPSIAGNPHSHVIDWDCVRFYSTLACSSDMVGKVCLHCNSPGGIVHLIEEGGGAVCECMIRNSLVFTPHNGHMYCITGILNDLNGNSPMKSGGKKVQCTYKEYFKSQYGITLQHEEEPLLCGRRLFTVQNWLQKRPCKKEKELSSASVELPPELCKVFMAPVSVSTVYTFSFIPSIMHRVEAMLLAVRLKKIMLQCNQNINLPTIKVLEALTTKKCQEGFSLESLETLGDSFLKYAAGKQLFRNNKYYHEGLLSAKKDEMVSNTSLCKLGCNRELPGFIRNECFDPKQWIMPGECSPYFGVHKISSNYSKQIHIRGTRHMKGKTVADAVEALIGAHLSTNGELAALSFMDWLGMKVNSVTDLPLERPLAQSQMYVNISLIEALLKYSFHDPSLLVEALTHGSFQIPDIPRCYQRLEFLGDSVLDYLITTYLYNTYPGISPGLLTDLRSASVNNDCYAHAAVKAGLHKHILHASSMLHQQMTFFINNFEQSFSGSLFGWETGAVLPKVLGDVIESIAGAILVDSGYDKEAVWRSIKPLLEPMVTLETIKYHPVRELEEICMKNSYEKTFVKSMNNGMASITAEVKADGKLYSETHTGANKKLAKKIAAKAVLDSLKTSIPGLALRPNH